jgi:DNA-binding transcriptional LysR family regulator
VAAEMVTTEGVRQSIKAGIGIAILSKRAVAEDLERGTLVALPLKGIQIIRPLYLIKRKNREPTPLCRLFWIICRRKARFKYHISTKFLA